MEKERKRKKVVKYGLGFISLCSLWKILGFTKSYEQYFGKMDLGPNKKIARP